MLNNNILIAEKGDTWQFPFMGQTTRLIARWSEAGGNRHLVLLADGDVPEAVAGVQATSVKQLKQQLAVIGTFDLEVPGAKRVCHIQSRLG